MLDGIDPLIDRREHVQSADVQYESPEKGQCTSQFKARCRTSSLHAPDIVEALAQRSSQVHGLREMPVALRSDTVKTEECDRHRDAAN